MAKSDPNAYSHFTLSQEDWDLTAELLRVAQVSLQESIYSLEARFPKSPFVETLRKWQEHAADIRERIESR